VEEDNRMKIALILAGAGQFDGSEIHETLMTLLALSEEKLEWMAFAPNRPQQVVINHFSHAEDTKNSRNILEESARLTRGKIAPLTDLIALLKQHPKEFSAIIVPGGFGVAIHLCSFKKDGFNFSFDPEVKTVFELAKAKGLPMGFICIAPVMIPQIYPGATLTIGNDPELITAIEGLGCRHQICTGTEIAVDEKHRVVSTPANMVSPTLDELHQGIRRLVQKIKQWVKL
jgi:enhancing lycopene biosynthesis protein 2